MKIFTLSMAIFMIPLKRPVMHMVSCRIIESGYYVFRKLLTSAWALSSDIYSLSFWSIVLLEILIYCGRLQEIISIMIYIIVSSMSFTFLNPPRIRFITMDYILLLKISEDKANIYRTFHTCPYHRRIEIIRKETNLSMNNANIIYQSCSSLFKEAYLLSILNKLLLMMQS